MAGTNGEKLYIRLHIYDTEIGVNVDPAEEGYYRRGAKLINDKYNQYAAAFKGKESDHKIAIYTLVDIALQWAKEHDRNDTKPYNDIISKLTAEIEDALREKKS